MPPGSSAAEQWLRGHRGPLCVLAVGLLGSVFVLWSIVRDRMLPGEGRIAAELQRLLVREDRVQLVGFVETLSTPPVALATVIVAVLIVLRRMGWRFALVVAGASAVVLVNAALKQLLGSTAAFVQLRGEVTDNFPSGGVSYATAVFGAFAWLGWIGRQRELSAVAIGLVLAMGVTRVARGAHVPSDVLAGYAVGAGWLLVTLLVLMPGPAVSD